MKILTIFLLEIFLIKAYKAWEFCQSEIHNNLCEDETHFVCDSTKSIPEPSCTSKEFLAHVPITRKVKKAFLNWHNYYRNRTAGGFVKNEKNIRFPEAVRMRELIWDAELSFLSHFRTKLVNEGNVNCAGTQRFVNAQINLAVKALDEPKPILEIIYLSLKEMFDSKNTIEYPYDMPKNFTSDHLNAKQFIIMVNDRVSRIGCAVSLGSDCAKNEGQSHKYCYYTACTYDYGIGGTIYKIGKPTGRCSRWGVGRSKMYANLCANSGEIFNYNE